MAVSRLALIFLALAAPIAGFGAASLFGALQNSGRAVLVEAPEPANPPVETRVADTSGSVVGKSPTERVVKSVKVTKAPDGSTTTPDSAALGEIIAATENETTEPAVVEPAAAAVETPVAEVAVPVELPPVPRPATDRPTVAVQEAQVNDELVVSAPVADQPALVDEPSIDEGELVTAEAAGPEAELPEVPIPIATGRPDDEVNEPTVKACRDVADLTDRDGDFSRNDSLLGKLCVEQHEFKENGAAWVVQVVKRTDRKAGPLWVVPHDDENAAFDTGLSSVAEYGGTMVTVETGGRRNNGSIDPNRIFTGNAKACNRFSPVYTALYIDNWNSGFPIIGLHTNGLKSAKTGGDGTISIKSPPGNADAFPSPSPFVGAKSAEDTLVFVASLQPKGKDAAVDKMVEKLTNAGMNVIREHVSEGRNDCSLSNYAALQHLQKYYNVEVVHGDAETQRRMVKLIMSMG